MKLKYRISDGEIIVVGFLKDLVAGPGEAVEDFNGTIPDQRLDFSKRIGPNQIVSKTPAEIDAVLKRDSKFNKASFKDYVNKGQGVDNDASIQGKFNRLLNVVAELAANVKESSI